MSTSDAPNLRRLARQLADYGRRLRHLETVPQLSNSSLDNQGMHVYDADGNVSVTLGKQEDGTYSARPVAGPTPPAPVGLDAEGDAGLIHASWQGVFWAGAAMPRDFEAVEVLVDGNVHGAIHDPDGGSVTVPAFAGERVVSFRTLSQAGRRSDATGHVTVTVQSKASVQLDEARGRIEDAEQSLGETQVRLDQAEQTITSTAEDLTRVETEVIPDAVADLEAADQAAAQELATLDGKLNTLDGVVEGKPDFDDLTVGNLLAGSVATPEAVIEKVWADGIAAKSISANRLMIGGTDGVLVPFPESYLRVSRPHFSGQPDGSIVYDGVYENDLDNRILSSPVDGQLPEGLYQIEVVAENLSDQDTSATLYHYRYKGTSYSSTGYRAGTDYDLPAGEKITHTAVEEIKYGTGETGFTIQTSIASPYVPIKFHSIRVTRVGKVGAVLIEDGAITTPKLTVTQDMSAAIVDAMTVNTKKLVVSEEAILNHATLIGETVVDDINVTGKLIGTDGVFTGTVDFENVNVTGLQLVEKLEANSISADKIEGGAFTGESFTGGTFIGGEFRTSDNLPGQVRLADDAYVTHFDGGGVFPGMRITPADASGFSHLPAIGPSAQGLTIYGGRGTGGGSSIVQCNPTESLMRTFRDDHSVGGVIQTSPTASLMRTYREDGGIGGSIQASPAKAFMQTYGDPAVGRAYSQVDPQKATMNVVGANGRNTARITADDNTITLFSSTNRQRYLKLNDTGIWIETGDKSYNLEETAQDSGWNNFSINSGLELTDQTGWRNKGGIIWLSGAMRYDWPVGAWTNIATMPAAIRPARAIRVPAPVDGRPTHLLEITASGIIRAYRPPNDAGGRWNLQISALTWPIG